MGELAAIFQIGSLGDSIVSLPSLRSLRELLPDCSEYLLVNPLGTQANVSPAQVFDMVWPARDRVAYRTDGHALGRAASVASLVGRLRWFRPRYAVCLMPSSRHSRQVDRDRLFFRMGGIRELIGFRALSNDEVAGRHGSGGAEAYLRFVRLWNERAAGKFPLYATPPLFEAGAEAEAHARDWLQKHRRHPDRKLVAVCPFGNRASRDWPASSVVELVRRLERDAGVEVAIAGGSKDAKAGDNVIALAGAGLNACGCFSVAESAAILRNCALVVAVDSGPMHLAAALGVPAIAAISRSDPEFGCWFPLGKAHTILYRETIECAGCNQDACPIAGHPCMRDVTVDQVFTVAMRKLNGLQAADTLTDGTRILNL